MKKNRTVQSLTQFSILLAIELILGFTPLGLITLPVASITLLHIPVIISAITLGWKQGTLMGLAFGIISLIKAITSAASPVDILFNPFVSGKPIFSIILCIVPRILLGLLAALLFQLLKSHFKNNTWSIGISTGLSTALHSLMVLGCLFLFFQTTSLQAFFATLISLNSSLEILVAIIICTPVCKALLKAKSQKY